MNRPKVGKRRMLAWGILVGLPIAVIAGLFVLSLTAGRPDTLGVREGRLAECPETPNCVSTQTDDTEKKMAPLPLGSRNAEDALNALERILTGMPRVTIIDRSENYLHAEAVSGLFRFVDDVELLVDEETGEIHFRSASRVGHSDLGVNRERMQQVADAWEALPVLPN